MRRRNAVLLFIGLMALLAGLAVFLFFSFQNQERPLTVTFLDVGQGDAIHVRTPAGLDVLIDGGPDASVLDGLGKAMPFFDRTIELLLLTHPDSDHYQGQIDVFERYRVRQIVTNGATKDSSTFHTWEDRAGGEGARMSVACAGSVFRLDHDIMLSVHAPTCEISTMNGDTNARSLIMKLTYGTTSFLLTGDAPVEEEHDALPLLSDVDVLKVGHHGSKTSTSEVLLNVTKPEIAIISAGKDNRYGHPHGEVLQRLQTSSIHILRTDVSGAIRCESNARMVSCQ